jgi:hypothetical protein
MQISEKALAEFINLYKAEFNEDISRDDAEIMARNLVMFYEDMLDATQKGRMKKRDDPSLPPLPEPKTNSPPPQSSPEA